MTSLAQRARHLRDLLRAAEPVLENALSRELTREDSWDATGVNSFSAGESYASPEAIGLAAALYKRGLKNAPPLPYTSASDAQTSLCAPCTQREGTELRAELAARATRGEIAIVIDERFAALHPAWGEIARRANSFFIDARESNKTLSMVTALLDHLTHTPASCGSLVSIGGGLTSDACGFAAGLVGAPFEVVPTTYLAAVDAAQGGKTGVNAPPFGKNQIGLFHGAHAFHLVPDVFSTLELEERASGFGEALKHVFLYGAWPLAGDSGVDFDALTLSPQALSWQMSAKVRVVEADPRERHVRRLLNLGHTLGHAWEGLQEEGLVSRLPHGMAVVFGLLALDKGGLLRGVPPDFRSILKELLARFSPQAVGSASARETAFRRLVRADKKNSEHGTIVFVTPAFGVLATTAPADFATLPEEQYVTRLPEGDAFALFEEALRG